MNAINTTVPYFYTVSAAPDVESLPVAAPTSRFPFLALFAGLALLSANPPEAGVVPASEIIPINDTQADLTLSEVVGRFEQKLGRGHKKDAYKLGKLVMQLSERHQFSPSMILAVVEAESSFRYNVISKVGAVGLMQLLPGTAKEVAKTYHVRAYKSAEDLKNPAVNLQLGVAYLSYLRHQFGHSIHYLAAYNLGPTALRRRLREGRYELGSLDPYVRTIHARARSLRGNREGGKLPSLIREEALLAASL